MRQHNFIGYFDNFVLQSKAMKLYYKVHQVLQSVADCYYKLCQVLQSET